MLNKEIMKEAHKLTKEIKKEYPEVDYKAQLGICISYLLKEGEKEMEKETIYLTNSTKVEVSKLEGTENQVKWAYIYRKDLIKQSLQILEEVNTLEGRALAVRVASFYKDNKEICQGLLNGAKPGVETIKPIMVDLMEKALENLKNVSSAKKIVEVHSKFKYAYDTEALLQYL